MIRIYPTTHQCELFKVMLLSETDNKAYEASKIQTECYKSMVRHKWSGKFLKSEKMTH